MKILKSLVYLALFIGMLYGATSCVVVQKRDHGKHYGWNKHSHHPRQVHRPPGQQKKQYKQQKQHKQKHH